MDSVPKIATRAIAWLLMAIIVVFVVAVVLDAIHGKEHAQGLARAGSDVEFPQRREAKAATRKGQDGRGAHGFFIAPRSFSTPHNKVATQ